ncbi:MAG: MATE family efflux transporter [Halioglobus sp.]
MAKAVFTRGSTMRHVLIMTGTSAAGMLAMFSVDLVDMYFLTLLGEQELAAAVGFAGTLLYFVVSVSIGLQIAMGALVARAEGSHQRELAGRYCSSSLVFNTSVAVAICLCAWFWLEELLVFLGASGQTLDYAISYTRILLPSMPILVLGMSAAAAVRALGDARRSMWATLVGALVNAILDPIFIFGFDWGLEGAAIASVVARIVVLVIAGYALVWVHKLPRRPSLAIVRADLGAIMHIAGPAMLTNIATPIGGGFVLKTIAQFGDGAVAGAAIMGRITPVAFAAVFALSSAVGPIIGQNAGAGLYSRVRSTLINAMLINVVYVVLVWGLLWLSGPWIVRGFSASPDAADLILFYTRWMVGAFMFTGALFIANASFNNLHQPRLATALNFSRVFLGIIPAVYLGGIWYGARGVIAGEAVGSIAFGLIGAVAVFGLVRKLDALHLMPPPEAEPIVNTVSGFSSADSQMAQPVVQAASDGLLGEEEGAGDGEIGSK